MTALARSCPVLVCLLLVSSVSGQELKTDPVPGNPVYVPKLGETAVVHSFDPFGGRRDPIGAWTSTEGFSQFCLGWDRALQSKEWLAAPANEKRSVIVALLKPLQEEAGRKGDRIELADLTKVKMLAYGTFNVRTEADARRNIRDDEFYTPNPDSYFVEILDGPQTGKKAWVNRFMVRVPTSKPFNLRALNMAKPTAENPDVPPKPQNEEHKSQKPDDVPTIRILDANWGPSDSGAYLVVTLEIRNVSQAEISLFPKVIFRDADNRLLKSESATAGTLAPGERTTVEIRTKQDPAIHHYNVQATGYVKGSGRGEQTIKILKRNE